MFSPLVKCAIFKVVFQVKSVNYLPCVLILSTGGGVCGGGGVGGVCVLLVKVALGELGTTVSKCIQLVCFYNSDIYA